MSWVVSSSSKLSTAPKPPHPSSIGGSLVRNPAGNILWPTTTMASRKKVPSAARRPADDSDSSTMVVVTALLFASAISLLPDTDTLLHTLRGHKAVATSWPSMARWPFINVNRLSLWFDNTGPTPDVGHLPVSIAGTASVVVCDVARTLRYHVEDSARDANPGNRFALISPLVFNNGNIGASSRTIHSTLTSSCGTVRNSSSAAREAPEISTTLTSGGQITALADEAKTMDTTSAMGDMYVSQARIVFSR